MNPVIIKCAQIPWCKCGTCELKVADHGTLVAWLRAIKQHEDE